MTLRTITTVMTAAILATSLLVSPVGAKPKCHKLCRQPIHDCVAAVPKNSTCTGTGTEKRTCRKGHHTAKVACKTNITALCKNDSNPDPNVCSPSGAFLDSSVDGL